MNRRLGSVWLFPFGKGDYLTIPTRVAAVLPPGDACVVGVRSLRGRLSDPVEAGRPDYGFSDGDDGNVPLASALDELSQIHSHVLVGYWGTSMIDSPQPDQALPAATTAMFEAGHLVEGVVAAVIEEEIDWADGYLEHAALALRGRRSTPPLLTRLVLGDATTRRRESRWPCVGSVPASWWTGGPPEDHPTIDRLADLITGRMHPSPRSTP